MNTLDWQVGSLTNSLVKPYLINRCLCVNKTLGWFSLLQLIKAVCHLARQTDIFLRKRYVFESLCSALPSLPLPCHWPRFTRYGASLQVPVWMWGSWFYYPWEYALSLSFGKLYALTSVCNLQCVSSFLTVIFTALCRLFSYI